MAEQPVLGCALNLSEGRRTDVIDEAAARAASAAHVLDVSSDADHNRTVLTLCGHPEPIVEAVLGAAAVAVQRIDLTAHSGVHPRLGAVDVAPFYPLGTAPMAAAVGAAGACARRLWVELGVPVFLYGEAAPGYGEAGPGGPQNALPWIRRNAFAGHEPDFGGPDPHPSAGAAVVGARGLLVAYNVDLATDELAVARTIAATLRANHAGQLRTLGLYLPSRNAAQVSMNIIEPHRFTLSDAYRAVSTEAQKAGVDVLGSEVVGLVPRACLGDSNVEVLALRETPKVLEEAVDRLFAD